MTHDVYPFPECVYFYKLKNMCIYGCLYTYSCIVYRCVPVVNVCTCLSIQLSNLVYTSTIETGNLPPLGWNSSFSGFAVHS